MFADDVNAKVAASSKLAAHEKDHDATSRTLDALRFKDWPFKLYNISLQPRYTKHSIYCWDLH